MVPLPRDGGIPATIHERDDQIAHRREKSGRPIDRAGISLAVTLIWIKTDLLRLA